ncbi:deleted in malignant brain tumors 1 protein-like [Lytechinus variegatus]|uniref:deleted in malignant brain tumors 1 protein-like n=1 Tax=Lytechinus variegatus TaxID=7654 RepID=UPI001BB1CB8A|nr:deleted in malignant brain tumors 1 protein-like [Lytechinus variegatus]
MNISGAAIFHIFLNMMGYLLAQGKTGPEPFDIQLSYGTTPYEGVVEIFINGEWTAICDDSMDFKTANVLCRMLGHGSAINYHCCGELGTGWGDYVLDPVRCEGHESSIKECYYSVKEHYYDESMISTDFCAHEEDVGLTCNPAQVRLKGGSYGPTMHEGKVEILRDKEWLAIYAESMDFNLAVLLCRMLDYFTAKGFREHERTGHHKDDVVNGSFKCTGEEMHFNDCPFSSGGLDHITNRNRVAWLTCLSLPVKILTSSRRQQGLVQVYYGTAWGKIAFNSWSMNEANVVCRMLGHDGASEATRVEARSMYDSVVLEWVQCNGTEINLAHCNMSEFVNRDAGDDLYFAGATCIGEPSKPFRLAGGRDPSEGRLEFFQYGYWGTMCAVDFNRLQQYSMNSARLICRKLGYPDALESHCCAHFGPGVGGIYIGLPACSVKDTNILACPIWYDITGRCNHFHDFGVTCQKNLDLEVRLVGGKDRSEGRVEVLYEGAWGTICDDNWDQNDANVVCRMLGYERADGYSCCSGYGEGAGDIVFDDVECNGSEANIGHCPRNKLRSHDCTHAEDVGVKCFGKGPELGSTTTADVHLPSNLDENDRTNYNKWQLSPNKTLGLIITLIIMFLIVNIAIVVLSIRIHQYRRRNTRTY